jgi:acetyl-CoA carboxylase biotin carboxyl carrier protein
MQDVTAPMTGVVLDVVVGLGAQVQAGDELVIVESMKMEIPVESPAPGCVAEVLVEPQQRVEEGDLLLRLEI